MGLRLDIDIERFSKFIFTAKVVVRRPGAGRLFLGPVDLQETAFRMNFDFYFFFVFNAGVGEFSIGPTNFPTICCSLHINTVL